MDAELFSKPLPAENTINSLVAAVKAQVEQELKTLFPTFVAKLYRYRIVSGIKYVVKVDVGQNQFIHLKIHADGHGHTRLYETEKNKSSSDPMVWESKVTIAIERIPGK